jgi:DNA repair photolyase
MRWTNPQALFEFWCDLWTLNPYDRCDFSCVYCCTLAQGVSRPKLAADAIVEQLARELASDPPKPEIVIGGASDPYPPAEAEHRVTRQIITALIGWDRRFHIVTKGLLIERDLDLLAPWAASCRIQVSISSLDAAALAVLEPAAPSPLERLALVRRLADAGLDVTVAATPWIPDLTDARELIAAVPRSIPIQFGPLTIFPHPGRERVITLFGRRYSQETIDRMYLEDRRRAGHHARVRWLYPALRPLTDGIPYLMSFLSPDDLLQPAVEVHSPAG